MQSSRKPFFILLFLSVFLIIISLRFYLFSNGISLLPELLYSLRFDLLLTDHIHAWSNSVSLGHSNLLYPESIGNRQIYGSIAPLSTVYWLAFLEVFYIVFRDNAQKAYFFFVLLLPILGMYFLASFWYQEKKSKVIPIIIAALFFGINGVNTGRFLAASLNHNISNGLLPLIIFCYLKANEIMQQPTPNRKQLIFFITLGGVLLSFVIQLRVHFLIIFSSFIFLYILFNLFKYSEVKKRGSLVLFKTLCNKLYRSAISYFLILGIGLLLNIHQWLPLLFYNENPLESSALSLRTLVMLLVSSDFASIKNSILLSANIIGAKGLLLPNFIIYRYLEFLWLIPFILSTIALIVSKNRKNVLLFSVLILSIIASSGLNSPFGEIFKWIYLNTPFLSPFRDPSKFLSLTIICYALLLGEFTSKINNYKSIRGFIVPVFILYLIAANPIFFSGNFYNNLTSVQIPSAYFTFQKWTNDYLNKTHRIFLLPSRTSIYQYKWFPQGISFPYSPNLFHGVLPIHLPLANTGWNNSFYGMRYYHFIENQINTVLPHLLTTINTPYILIDTSLPEGEKYKKIVEKIPYIKTTKSINNLHLYTNTLLTNRDNNIVYYNNYALLAGDPYIATISGNIPFISLYQNDHLPTDKDIFFYDTTTLDITASRLYKKYALDIESQMVRSNGGTKNDWTDGLGDIKAYDRGIHIESKIPIMTYTKARLSIPLMVPEQGDYVLILRPGFHDTHGTIQILLDNKPLSIINLSNTYGYSGFAWIHLPLAYVSGGIHTLDILNVVDKTSAIDGVALIPYKVFQKEKARIESISKKNGFLLCTSTYSNFLDAIRPHDSCRNEALYKNIVPSGSIHNFFLAAQSNYSQSEVMYTRISPTHYTFREIPSTNGLVLFNQSYSQYWELNGQKPVIANFYANAYVLNNSSQTQFFSLYYKPEKIYKTGIITSFTFYCVAIGILLLLLRKGKIFSSPIRSNSFKDGVRKKNQKN